METSQMKNIVIIKNIPSNIVEEAIVFLKNDEKIKTKMLVNSNEKKQNINKENDYIVNEAQMLISSYIKNIENKKEMSEIETKLINRCERLKHLAVFFGVAAILGIIVNLIS